MNIMALIKELYLIEPRFGDKKSHKKFPIFYRSSL